MIYDLAKLKSQGIPAESLADWLSMTTDADVRSCYRKMVAFYQKWGFNTFWAYKDQQWLATHPTVLSYSEKLQYIEKMFNNPPEGCDLERKSLKERLIEVFRDRSELFAEAEPTPEGEESEETDGEFGLINIDGTDYGFRLDELSNFIGGEVYEWGYDEVIVSTLSALFRDE